MCRGTKPMRSDRLEGLQRALLPAARETSSPPSASPGESLASSAAGEGAAAESACPSGTSSPCSARSSKPPLGLPSCRKHRQATRRQTGSVCAHSTDGRGREARAGTHFSIGRGEARAGLAMGGLFAELGYPSSSWSLSGVGIRAHGFSQAAWSSQG